MRTSTRPHAHEPDLTAEDTAEEVAERPTPRRALLGRAVGWVQADHLRRGPVAVIAGAYGAAAAAHALQAPAVYGLPLTVFATLGMYARTMNLPREQGPNPLLSAAATAAGGLWFTAAAQWGVTFGPYTLGAWLGAATGALVYYAYRRDPVIRTAIAWEQAKIDWHCKAPLYGLTGSHLVDWRETRLGEQMEIDTIGTRRRASQIVGGDIEERIAEIEGLKTSRVKVRRPDRAGRITISIRYKDPWVALPHPLLDPTPEIPLPKVADAREPIIIGMDPESGRPLEIVQWDEEGAKRVFVVATTGGGKTVLLSNALERLTAADNAWVILINVSKGKEARRWRRACGASACGPGERVKALRLLEMARHIIDYRGAAEDGDEATVEPRRDQKLVAVVVDETDKLLGPGDRIGLASRREFEYLTGTGRSEAVSVLAVGRRGTVSNMGSGDIRADIDQVLIGKVNRRSEMQHAVGEYGLTLPDMGRYGEGHSGVILSTDLSGHWTSGRTWLLDKLTDIDDLTEGRTAGDLEPGLVAYLRQRMGSAVVDWLLFDGPEPGASSAGRSAGARPAAAPSSPAPPADTAGPFSEDQAVDRAAAAREAARATLAQAGSRLDTTLTPGERRALAIARRQQAAEQTEIGPELRELIVGMLSRPDGTTLREVETAMQAAGYERGVSKTGAWRCLDRLRFETVAELRGAGRAARWYLAVPSADELESELGGMDLDGADDDVERLVEEAAERAAEDLIDRAEAHEDGDRQ
ncbi:hypothetical protein JOL79_11135 [Microbispora sp. RL4-1S]|uniref:FtsK domain-containing protein n=1 Tax=Microbispora oryzae TaxID=2806554 RepID=A0A941AHR3_9ACTN|nr:hypothetical protein [Microbispora oryzae]MBP2704366.1 hypothetical protein [Microbispora oryzae]